MLSSLISRGTTILTQGISASFNSAISYLSKKSLNPAVKAKEITNIFSGTSENILKQASIDVEAVDFAYNMFTNKAQSTVNKIILERTGVTFQESTDDILGKYNSGKLQGAIFTDESNKRIILAIAGTRQDSLSNFLADLTDDGLVAGGFNTYKTAALRKVNEYILEHYAHLIEAGYEVHYTGHSLGGHSANVGANIMAGMFHSEGIDLEKISVTTFDSAGGDTAFTNSAKYTAKILDKDVALPKKVLFKGPNVTFDSRPNMVNNLDHKKTVTKYTVHHEKHGEYDSSSWAWGNVKSWLNPTKLLAEHGLSNFKDAFKGLGSIMDEHGNTLTHHSGENVTSVPFDQLLLDNMPLYSSSEGKLYCMTFFNKATHKQDTRYFYEDQYEDAKQKYAATLSIPTNTQELSCEMIKDDCNYNTSTDYYYTPNQQEIATLGDIVDQIIACAA